MKGQNPVLGSDDCMDQDVSELKDNMMPMGPVGA